MRQAYFPLNNHFLKSTCPNLVIGWWPDILSDVFLDVI